MPVISGSVTLVANTRSAEQITGPYEFLPFDAHVEVYAITSVAVATNTTLARVLAGSDVILDDRVIPYVGTTIDQSANLVDEFDVFKGTRMSVTYLSAGTPVVIWIVKITPL
jgi:hypothetical protein